MVVHSANDYTRRKMLHCSWLEKIPFALIEEVRNLNNVVAPNIAKIIKQGVENKEFSCEYPQELAGMLVFSIDILLDPVLFKREYSEVCNRLDFFIVYVKKMDIPLIDECGIQNLRIYLNNDSNKSEE